MSYMSKAKKENIFLMKNNNNMSYVSKVIKIIMSCLCTGRNRLADQNLVEWTKMGRINQNEPKFKTRWK